MSKKSILNLGVPKYDRQICLYENPCLKIGAIGPRLLFYSDYPDRIWCQIGTKLPREAFAEASLRSFPIYSLWMFVHCAHMHVCVMHV